MPHRGDLSRDPALAATTVVLALRISVALAELAALLFGRGDRTWWVALGIDFAHNAVETMESAYVWALFRRKVPPRLRRNPKRAIQLFMTGTACAGLGLSLHRVLRPEPSGGLPTVLAGLFVCAAFAFGAWLLARARRRRDADIAVDAGEQAALALGGQHLGIGDAGGGLALAVGAVFAMRGVQWMDAVAGLFIACLILVVAWWPETWRRHKHNH